MNKEENSNESNLSIEEAMAQVPQKDKAYVSGLTQMLHSKKTSTSVVDMLKSAPPEQSIPRSAMEIHTRYEGMIKERSGKAPGLNTALIGGVYLVTDLIEIGNAANIFKIDPQQEIGPYLQSAMQMYIERGLKDGTIDPIELQAITESNMSPEEMQENLGRAQSEGSPMQPGQDAAMESYASGRERKLKNKLSVQAANKERKGGVLGNMQGQPPQEPTKGE